MSTPAKILSTRPTPKNTARPYQAEAIKIVNKHLFEQNKPAALLQSPTGSGKTFMANEIMFEAVNRGMKVLFLIHTDGLKRSTATALCERFSIYEIQIVDNGGIRAEASVVVITTQTFTSRLQEKSGAKHHNWGEIHLKRFGLVVFDEVHLNHFNHIAAASMEIHGQKRFGLTATPKRPLNSPLQLWQIFDKKVKTISYVELIEKGFNVPPFLVKASAEEMVSDADFAGLKLDFKGGEPEYNMGSVSKIMREKRKIYDGLIGKYKYYARPDTKGAIKMIVFCTDIAHVMDTYQKFKEAGINAKFMTSAPAKESETEKLYRTLEKDGGTYSHKMILLDFAAGRFQVLINAGIATTGIDIPSIQAVGLLRPTLSENLYLQMCGRGNRPYPDKKEYILFDFAGNVKHFGLPVIERDYPWGATPKKKTSGVPPMKNCPKCGNMVFASARTCTNPTYSGMVYESICGHIFPFERASTMGAMGFMEVSWEKILEISGKDFGTSKVTKDASVLGIYEFWKAKGFKPLWFYYKLYELHGTPGLIEFATRTGRDVEKFLSDVAKNTSLNPYADDVEAELERIGK